MANPLHVSSKHTVVDIAAKLSGFNGKNVQPFRQVARSVNPSSDSVETLLGLAETDEEAFQIGATWVMKRWLENGQRLSADQTKRLLRFLKTINATDAKLHLLQMLPALHIPDDHVESLYQTALRLTSSDNKFVKAWACNALAVVAQRQPRYLNRALPLRHTVLETESASVKARVRNALKALDEA